MQDTIAFGSPWSGSLIFSAPKLGTSTESADKILEKLESMGVMSTESSSSLPLVTYQDIATAFSKSKDFNSGIRAYNHDNGDVAAYTRTSTGLQLDLNFSMFLESKLPSKRELPGRIFDLLNDIFVKMSFTESMGAFEFIDETHSGKHYIGVLERNPRVGGKFLLAKRFDSRAHTSGTFPAFAHFEVKRDMYPDPLDSVEEKLLLEQVEPYFLAAFLLTASCAALRSQPVMVICNGSVKEELAKRIPQMKTLPAILKNDPVKPFKSKHPIWRDIQGLAETLPNTFYMADSIRHGYLPARIPQGYLFDFVTQKHDFVNDERKYLLGFEPTLMPGGRKRSKRKAARTSGIPRGIIRHRRIGRSRRRKSVTTRTHVRSTSRKKSKK